MGDRHKTPRLYKSGTQKRKLAADRKKNSEESLSSIPKLTNYFSTSRLLAKNSSSQLTKDLVNVVDTSNNQSEFDENLDNCDEELFEKSSVIQDRCERPDHETNQGNISNNGYCDWKHASERLRQHETSKEHLQAVIILSQRGKEIGCIDKSLKQQMNEESGYWNKILMRVVSTIKFLCERGLALRELIAEYDPFLSTHIKKHANKGSGHTNYLSSTICEELVSLMAKSVLNEIITRLKISKYYSVSVDSTPDEGHIDQLTVIFRYMENLIPVERFLTFLPNSGHTGKAITETLIHFLNENKIDIKDCRGQSYDNAANMSGKYNGMQAFIKRVNGYAIFVPCCGHSLNLVGKTAANSCPTAIKFFDFVQNIYVFFTSSPSRYQILTKKLSLKNSNTQFHVPKNLNDTRWSCRADATKALVLGYNEFKETLEYISKDPEQKEVVKNEANQNEMNE
ncbi:hypothetical protein AGLY_017716 [Aphis glycines]|uniref:DUF4371 domain-containing protein n=1 Tax=Aphis glycines TaxID=307491 RepID=A0A6G0SUC4_APHGL|nr:hypothetical protein AGLY_017716 [Aphis glycines]